MIMIYLQGSLPVPAPVASAFSVTGGNGTTGNFNAGAYVSGSFTSIAVTNDGGSGATISGNLIVIPASLAAGTYAVQFQANGPGGLSNIATMTLTQSATAPGPVAPQH